MRDEQKMILRDGAALPAVGYGTYKAAGEEAVAAAYAAGYRYFDTAAFYGNEEAVGRALGRYPREAWQVATKIWKTELGYDRAWASAEESLRRLGVDYVDVLLIHWPKRTPDDPDWQRLDRETWRAMEEMRDQGMVKTIGVSNFLPHHLESLFVTANVPPAIDQIEFHPGYLQAETVDFCRREGILVQAWSPLGRMRLTGHPLLAELGEKYGVSPARICLRFALELGVMPLPKSSDSRRMAENLDLFSFALEPSDVERLRGMEETGWSGEHPDRERVIL